MCDESIIYSVIIPVYNAAGYLVRCVDSVLASIIEVPAEVILVDDGSTDDSAAMCDAYAAGDARIQVLHTENGGASSARNMGIRAARGEYLLFVDSDDYVRPGALREIRQTRCDVTLLCADMILADGKARPFTYRYDTERIRGKTAPEVLDYLTELSRYPVSPCVKMLRRSFVLENGLFFAPGIVCEDVDHTYSVLLAANSFDYCSTPYYVACRRPGSVMTAPENTQKRFDSTLWIIEKWTKIADNDAHGSTIRAFLAAQFVYLCALYADMPRPARQARAHNVKNYAWLLSFGKNRRFAAARLAYCTLGLALSSWLFKKAFL